MPNGENSMDDTRHTPGALGSISFSALLAFSILMASVAGVSGAVERGEFVPTGPMSRPRAGHTATLLQDGRVLMFGGWSGSSNVAEIYDPATRTFSTLSASFNPREGHSATLLADGRVLIAGGCCIFNIGFTAMLIDPVTGQVTETGMMNQSQWGHTGTLLPNGKVLIAGGLWDPIDGTPMDPELYDPITNKFTVAGRHVGVRDPFKPPGGILASTLLPGGRVFFTGGQPEIYDPASGHFRLTTPMVSPRYRVGVSDHSATLLRNGTVLIIGRSPESAPCGGIDAPEIFDPATETFRAISGTRAARNRQTATLLADGNVLLVGGLQDDCRSADAAELYEPATESFVSIGRMTQPRREHTATLLGDGTVLIAGGRNDSPGVVANQLMTAELYRPESSTPPPGGGNCTPDPYTACLLGRFKVQVRYRNGFDHGPVDTQALAKVTAGFAETNYETSFFYFNSANNAEVMVKVLDQGNQLGGVPTIAVITGIATPLRVEVSVTDTSRGGTRSFVSEFGSQAGVTDFTAFPR
jgi:hypothetical protein